MGRSLRGLRVRRTISRVTTEGRECSGSFEEQGLTVERLRELNQHQLGLISTPPRADVPLNQIGGFLAIPTASGSRVQAKLAELQIFSDYRGESLRLGPAPYVSTAQLSRAKNAVESQTLRIRRVT